MAAELLDNQTYSGVGTDLEEIITRLSQGRKESGAGSKGISAIDSSLLKFNSFLLEEDLHKHFLEKIKQVQVGTSKRVIKQFHKNAVLVDVGCQTGFNDDVIIKDLTFRNKQLRSDLDEATEGLVQE